MYYNTLGPPYPPQFRTGGNFFSRSPEKHGLPGEESYPAAMADLMECHKLNNDRLQQHHQNLPPHGGGAPRSELKKSMIAGGNYTLISGA